MSNIQPPDTRTVRVAELLEGMAGIAIRLGRNGMVLTAPILIGYVLLGALLTWTGLIALPYPFLSVASDPVFNLLGFVVGCAITLASAGLLILLPMNGFERTGNQLAMLLVGMSIGTGIAVLRFTHETALAALLAGVRLLLKFLGVG